MLAATDHLGHRHLYWCQGDGWAAMGTSSLALAYLAGAGMDKAALAVYGQLGFHLGCATPFAGVRKLGPGGLCALVAGDRAPRPVRRLLPAVTPGSGWRGTGRARHRAVPHRVVPHRPVHRRPWWTWPGPPPACSAA